MSWTDLTLQQAIMRAAALLFIAAVHGYATAAIARALGDRGPAHDGRATLNPIIHLDLLGGASLILFSVGWIRPMDIDLKALRFGRLGALIVVAGAGVATLACAALLLTLRPFTTTLLSDTTSFTAFALLNVIGDVSLWFVLINLLPIFPFAGGYLTMNDRPGYARARRVLPFVALALGVSGVLVRALAPLHLALAGYLLL